MPILDIDECLGGMRWARIHSKPTGNVIALSTIPYVGIVPSETNAEKIDAMKRLRTNR
jgi:hypothetical protein